MGIDQKPGKTGEIVNVELVFQQDTEFSDDLGRWSLDPVDAATDYTVTVKYYTVEFLATDSGMALPPLKTVLFGTNDSILLAVGNWTVRTRAYNASDLLVGYTASQEIIVTASGPVTLEVLASSGGAAGVYANTGVLNLTIDWSILGSTVDSLRIGLTRMPAGPVVIDPAVTCNNTPVSGTDTAYTYTGMSLASGDYLLTVYLYETDDGTGIPLAVVGTINIRVYDGASIDYTYRLTAGTHGENLQPHALPVFSIGWNRYLNGTQINWACSDIYATGFRIYRKRAVAGSNNDPADYTLIGTVTGSDINSFVDTVVALSADIYDMSYVYMIETMTQDYGTAFSCVPGTFVQVDMPYVAYVDPDIAAEPALTGNCGWPGNPFKTLVAAQNYINSRRPSGYSGEIRLFANDTVTLGSGFTLDAGIRLRGGYGTMDNTCDYPVHDFPTTIRYNAGAGSDPVISVMDPTASAIDTELFNLNIIQQGTGSGSAVRFLEGAARINNCRIEAGPGASVGVYLQDSASEIVNSVIIGGGANTGTTYGINIVNNLASGIQPRIYNNAINGGTGTGGFHYGIRLDDDASQPDIRNNIFFYSTPGPANQTGIYNTDNTITLTGNLFSNCDQAVSNNGVPWTIRDINSGVYTDVTVGAANPNYEFPVLVNAATGRITGGVPALVAFGGDFLISIPANDRGGLTARTDPYSIGPWEEETPISVGSLTVSATADVLDGDYRAGYLTLREAVMLANIDTPASPYNVINFTPALASSTIALTPALGPLRMTRQGVHINGDSDLNPHTHVTVSGQNAIRILEVDDEWAAVNNSMNVTVDNLRFFQGRAANGGALNLTESDITFSNCVFEANAANGTGATDGGGVLSLSVGTDNIHFSACRFANNSAPRGGVFRIPEASNISFNADRCVFTGNYVNDTVTDYGGVIYFAAGLATGRKASLTNSVFRQNHLSSNSAGGTIAYQNGTSDLTVTHCTFFENATLTTGDDLFTIGDNGSILTLNNSLIWGGATSPLYPAIDNSGLGTVNINSVICPSGELGSLDADPQFVTPADPDGLDNRWGTADDGLRIGPDSPALDAGGYSTLLTWDITGTATSRQIGPRADIGAYESLYDISAMTRSGPLFEADPANFTAVCLSGSNLYAGMSDGTLRRYTVNASGVISATPAAEYSLGAGSIDKIVDSGMYIVARIGGTLYIREQATGEPYSLNPSISPGGGFIDYDAVNSNLFCVLPGSGYFARYPITGGSFTHTTNFPTAVKIDVEGNIAVVAHSDGTISVFDAMDQSSLFGASMASPSGNTPVKVKLAPDLSRFYVVYANGDQLIKTGTITTTPAWTVTWGIGDDHQQGTGVMSSGFALPGAANRVYSVNGGAGKLDRLTDITLANDGATFTHTDSLFADIDGNATYAYVAGNTTLQSFNMTGPAPALVSTVYQEQGVHDVVVDGNYLYAACGAAGVRIFDISGTNRTNPQPVARIGEFSRDGIVDYQVVRVIKSGNYLIAAVYQSPPADRIHLVPINVTNPVSPVRLPPSSHRSQPRSAPSDLWMDEDHGVLHVGCYGPAFYQWNLPFDGATGVFGSGYFSLSDLSSCVMTHGNRAFYGRDGFLYYYTLAAPFTTDYSVTEGTLAVPVNIIGARIFGGRLVVLSNTGSIALNIYDFNEATPSASASLGSFTSGGLTPNALAIRYPYAVVSHGGTANGVYLINTANVSVMTGYGNPVGTDPVKRTVYHTGGYFYAAAGDGGLYVFSYAP